ncbi:MAG: hypothetical protein H6711_15590 [Myxococcales bacterium]|nr:hypothetical protein [Myxococcales bacterium]
MRFHGGLCGATIALLLLAPSLARAGDGLHPRTPALFENPPCMTIVNRSVDPVLHFEYTIPYEDLKPVYNPDDPATWHEVDDGRTHQFFAFCRDHDPQNPLPNWITWADVDKAVAKDLIDPMNIPDSDVFETNADWKDCWFRITADDDRRLITFAEAAKGVDWDTTGLPVGGHVVEGYTWEPWINIWSFRTGVVKVVDSDDLAASPPALALEDNQDYTLRWRGAADERLLLGGRRRDHHRLLVVHRHRQARVGPLPDRRAGRRRPLRSGL